jgi:SAM-dependent methyltransferase
MNARMRPLDPRQVRQCVEAFLVLDTRDPEAFTRGHLRDSGHIPRAELKTRRAELPPRGTPLLVVAESAADAAEAAGSLEAMGYPEVAFLDAPLATLPGGLVDRAPASRLWRPASFLEEALPLIGPAEPEDARSPARRALDLASGSGRDAVFLAMRGFQVESWDHDAEALARARDLARRHGVPLRAVVRDLESPGLALPDHPFDLITCFRFLHRPLFPWIEGALAPGGWLVYETYRAGQERFGKPKRAQFLLERNELAGAFPGLTTVRYEEREPEGGPVTARLLAHKPGRA